MPWLLAASAFLAAALSFLIQPLVARLLLPTYGGSAAVWTTALVFFQSTLVAGYAWAHLGPRRLGVRRHAEAQVVVAAAAAVALPVAVHDWARPAGGILAGPWLLATLAVMVGLPFLALAANGPTVQRWYAIAVDADDVPYRLFAASNAGSLLGLLAYPILVEPNLDLVDQGRWWAVGYLAFVAVTAAAAAVVRRRETGVEPAPGPAAGRPIPRGRRVRWVALAAIPVAAMVGVTAHLSTDVAAVPLLWVVPLAVYLLTMILAYARRAPIAARPATILLAPLAVLAIAEQAGWLALPIGASFAVHLGALCVAGLALHGALAADRPPSGRLTEYTLRIAIGGALGGLAAGIVGPLAFPAPIEAPIAFAAAVVAVVRPGPRASRAGRARGLVARLAPALVAGMVVVGLVAQPAALASVRTLYGTYRVVEDGGRHVLYAGSTIHGVQDRRPGGEREPWAYYGRSGPLGQVLETLLAAPQPLRIGAVGLGAGAVAAYGRPGDSIEFLEIDPAVERIATDPALFTYLADSPAGIAVVIGDGRLLLAERPPGAYEVLILDAFSSDAIPVHLLTVEGLDLAMSRVAPGGIVALHISNRYLDLEPVVAAAARRLGLVAILGSYLPPGTEVDLAQASQWIVLGRRYSDVAGLVEGDDWRTAHAADRPPWTDRWSDLLGAIR